jgi:hypothetical protein
MRASEEVRMPGDCVWRREDFIDKAEELLLEAAKANPAHPIIAAYAVQLIVEERQVVRAGGAGGVCTCNMGTCICSI